MNMKKLIESMDRIEECGMSEMPAMSAPMQQGNPVTVNVSMNASGKEHVADLLDMMKNAGLGGAEPVAAKMLSPRMDMERLSGIMNGPMDDPEMEEIDDEMGEGPCPECGMEPCECDHAEEGYANEPDAQYGDMSDAIPNGNDLNRKKGAYKVVAGGDNPMEYTMEVESIKAALLKALTEKKAKPDFLDVDKDGDKKEPMKKALKDKGSKPKKGQVPPQFKKK
jgi:hypothetical protein